MIHVSRDDFRPKPPTDASRLASLGPFAAAAWVLAASVFGWGDDAIYVVVPLQMLYFAVGAIVGRLSMANLAALRWLGYAQAALMVVVFGFFSAVMVKDWWPVLSALFVVVGNARIFLAPPFQRERELLMVRGVIGFAIGWALYLVGAIAAAFAGAANETFVLVGLTGVFFLALGLADRHRVLAP